MTDSVAHPGGAYSLLWMVQTSFLQLSTFLPNFHRFSIICFTPVVVTMNAALAQALAREAMKKKPDLNPAEIQVKEKVEKEPQKLVDLQKVEVAEKQAIEVNAIQLEKVELKKAQVAEKKAIEVNSEAIRVQLKKAQINEKPNHKAVNATPAINVQLKKAPEKGEGQVETPTNSSAPTVTLRHREVEQKPRESSTSEEPKLMAQLRKPGKGRFRNLEQFYD